VFGAGGGTSSYEEIRNTDLIILWGSNARETHPIFFHHVLKAVHRGARLIVVDPRKTASAQWADLWLGIDVGTDIALANGIAREIIVTDSPTPSSWSGPPRTSRPTGHLSSRGRSKRPSA
jgi:anaerobic selenocysteine-containing dehydrogenase